MNHKTDMNVGRESDGRVLPEKYPNKDGKSSAEGAEGRRPAKENTGQTTASQMQSWGNALDGLDRAGSSKEEQGVTIHRATAPRIRRASLEQFLCPKARSG